MRDDSASPAEVFHLSVRFTGRVQGVGFRYETLQIAKGYEVTGFVKNLADGAVQLEAEGDEGEVAAFVGDVEEALGSYIRHAEKRGRRQKQRFFNFTIQ